MSDLSNPNPGHGDVSVDRVMASPALQDIVAEAGLNADDLSSGQLRVWRSFNEDGKPQTRVVFAALTVDHLASRVRFHVLYDDNDEVRMTFSLAGCLLSLEGGEAGLDATRSMQSLIEEVLLNFRWAVEHLPAVH